MNEHPNSIVIDKCVPIPAKMTGRAVGGGRPRKWPFHLMEIGDSFAAHFKDGETTQQVMRRVDYVYAGKSLGRKFTSRLLIEDGARVVRFWRVA